MGEVLRFQGLVRLATCFEFVKRDELWSTIGKKYMPAVEFGEIGMGRDRFKEILSAHRYSKQPPSRPSNLCSEQYQWVLVDYHVANFNRNRSLNYHPSASIFVGESMSRWYGIGGHWINSGLLQYIVIDRKPENCCEIQNDADGVSGIMMHLKLVKTSSEEDIHSPEEHDGFFMVLI